MVTQNACKYFDFIALLKESHKLRVYTYTVCVLHNLYPQYVSFNYNQTPHSTTWYHLMVYNYIP